MKKLLMLLVFIFLFSAGIFFQKQLLAKAYNVLYTSTCDNPKTYRIGSIDPKYNMTDTDFINDIQKAGNIWGASYGKELFKYDSNGNIIVNLVYDQRSFLSSQISDLDSKIRQQQNELDPKIADYKSRAAGFKAKIDQLNSDIAYWNSKGGAAEDEYNKLKTRQAELQQEAQSLRAEAQTLNQSTDQYNQQVGQLHQTVNSFNQQLSYKPEEGEYIYDNGKQTINIYFDNSQAELLHTLAHELGHALGIGHNQNANSIMFPQTTEVITASQEDINGLSLACKRKGIFEIYIQNFQLFINLIRLRLSS